MPIGRFDSDCDGAWMDSLEGGLSILGKDVAERRLATAELLWGNVRLKTTYGSGIAAFWHGLTLICVVICMLRGMYAKIPLDRRAGCRGIGDELFVEFDGS